MVLGRDLTQFPIMIHRFSPFRYDVGHSSASRNFAHLCYTAMHHNLPTTPQSIDNLMGRIYVAVDLETTGLDPNKDTIIELGAARFRDGEVLEEFSQVVNPGRRIPQNIQQLTGITQAEADRAPSLSSVANAFRTFIGDHPLVGHNVSFDAAFLESHNLYRFNQKLDTWELAVILMPGLPSYKLGRIAADLGIDLENAHRAFDDAEATMRIFEIFREIGQRFAEKDASADQ